MIVRHIVEISEDIPLLLPITSNDTDQVYTDRQLARVSVLTFDVTSTVYASASGKCLASVWQASGKCNEKI